MSRPAPRGDRQLVLHAHSVEHCQDVHPLDLSLLFAISSRPGQTISILANENNIISSGHIHATKVEKLRMSECSNVRVQKDFWVLIDKSRCAATQTSPTRPLHSTFYSPRFAFYVLILRISQIMAFEPSLSTSGMRPPLASADAPSMADSLPSINFGFEDLRNSMAQFTVKFDAFIERGRKRVLEERNQFHINLAEYEGMC